MRYEYARTESYARGCTCLLKVYGIIVMGIKDANSEKFITWKLEA